MFREVMAFLRDISALEDVPLPGLLRDRDAASHRRPSIRPSPGIRHPSRVGRSGHGIAVGSAWDLRISIPGR